MDKKKADRILDIVIEEFEARGLLIDEYEQVFGFVSFDEISERIQNEA